MSTDVDIDMNVELMAHGYSNGLVGVFGGGCVCVCARFARFFVWDVG